MKSEVAESKAPTAGRKAVDPLLSGEPGARATRSIASLLRTLLVIVPLLLLVSYHSATTVDTALLAGLLVAVFCVYLVNKTARLPATIAGLIAILITYAIITTLTYGSIRGLGVLGFVGAIVVGGIFLGRGALIGVVAFSATALGMLTYAETAGLLPAPDFSVNTFHWATHSAVLAAIALNVFYSRSLAVEALLRARESEQRLERIFRGNPAALVLTSLTDSRIVDVNDAYERMFNVPRSEAVGTIAGRNGLWVDPARRALYLARVKADGRLENTPAQMKRRNGEAFEALISAELLEVGDTQQILTTVTDISELARERAARLASEDRLQSVFRSSPVAMIVTNFDERMMISGNEAAERIFRVRAKDFIGRPVNTQLYADPEQAVALREQVMAEGRIAAVPVRMLRSDGEPFEARMSQEVFESAGVRYAITTVEDVSVEHAAIEALKLSEQRFSSAFRLNPIGMALTRFSDGTYIDMSEAEPNALGYTRAESVGRTAQDLGIWASAEDRARFRAKLMEERQVYAFETRMRNKAGELIDCLVWAALIEIDGEACVLSSTMNITDKKREENLLFDVARGVSGQTGEPFFRSLVGHLGNALGADIVIVGEIVTGQRVRTLAMLRDGVIAPNIEYSLVGTPCETTANPSSLAVYPDRVAELFPTDTVLVKEKMRGYFGIALRDPQGSSIGILNIVCRAPIEHTPRTEALFRIFAARAQAELLRMRRDREILALNESLELRVAERTAQLEAANRELEAFSYSVSHDLRAPLRAIDGFVRVLAGPQASKDDAMRIKAQERVVGAVKRMNDLINDLIGLARVSGQEIQHEKVDLSALARKVGENLLEHSPDRAVDLRVSASPPVSCDRALMRIVLENLLGNAWKFTGKRPDARVEFGAEPQPDGKIAFFVRDNGAGFDPQYADRLFAPFQRLHSDHEFEGTGIGLATVQRIIARHGGRVWAVSEPDSGACFYFTCEAA